MNHVRLMGNVKFDPKLSSKSGDVVLSFFLETKEVGKDGIKTEIHNIVWWNKRARAMFDKIKAGSLVMIDGKIVSRQTESGKVIEILAKSVFLIDGLTSNAFEDIAS